MYCSVEKTVEKIEDACRFTTRLLEHGDSVEILALRRVVGSQLMNLSKNTPKNNITYSIEFQTDYNHFEKTVKVITRILKYNVFDLCFFYLVASCNITKKKQQQHIAGGIWKVSHRGYTDPGEDSSGADLNCVGSLDESTNCPYLDRLCEFSQHELSHLASRVNAILIRR